MSRSSDAMHHNEKCLAQGSPHTESSSRQAVPVKRWPERSSEYWRSTKCYVNRALSFADTTIRLSIKLPFGLIVGRASITQGPSWGEWKNGRRKLEDDMKRKEKKRKANICALSPLLYIGNAMPPRTSYGNLQVIITGSIPG